MLKIFGFRLAKDLEHIWVVLFFWCSRVSGAHCEAREHIHSFLLPTLKTEEGFFTRVYAPSKFGIDLISCGPLVPQH